MYRPLDFNMNGRLPPLLRDLLMPRKDARYPLGNKGVLPRNT